MPRQRKAGPKVWTYEIIRDGLIRRGFCVSFVIEDGDVVITAERPQQDFRRKADGERMRAVIRLRNGEIVLPKLGEL